MPSPGLTARRNDKRLLHEAISSTDSSMRCDSTADLHPDSLQDGLRKLSPYAGSVTEMIRCRTCDSPIKSAITAGQKRASSSAIAISMSAAPVESLGFVRQQKASSLGKMSLASMGAGHGAQGRPARRRPSRFGQCAARMGRVVCSDRARQRVPIKLLCFLIILGLLAALIGFVMDVIIDYIQECRIELYEAVTDSPLAPRSKVWLQFVVWIGGMLTFVWIAIWITKLVAPQAAGSGIPEMKSILAGTSEGNYLSRSTLLTKVLPRAAASCAAASRRRTRWARL